MALEEKNLKDEFFGFWIMWNWFFNLIRFKGINPFSNGKVAISKPGKHLQNGYANHCPYTHVIKDI